MKNIFIISMFILLTSCRNQKNIIGTYFLNKENGSYNVILNVKSNNRYKLETVGTGSSGIVEGNWQMTNQILTLMPDKSIIERKKWGESIVDVEVFRPFSDTIKYKMAGKKIIKINLLAKSPKMTLFRVQ